MKQTYDVNVDGFEKLVTPETLKKEFPVDDQSQRTVVAGRDAVKAILKGEDKRLIVITGPCSIHDEKATYEYAEKLKELKNKVNDSFEIIMRVYFEKPRTTVGWKGLINDPCMDGTCDLQEGLRNARKLLLDINHMGIPVATEILDPIIPQYIAGLVCWTAIGARTTESQTHREMASGLSMPVGFKNCTDGTLTTAINAVIAAGSPQSFLGIDPDGKACIVKTKGNKYAHIVMRGGARPNYDSVSIRQAINVMENKNINASLIIDCSHANSGKKWQGQQIVWEDVLQQKINGNENIKGLMLESFLFSGNQKISENYNEMAYGVSVTDECISWELTQELIMSAHKKLSGTAK